MKRIIFLFLILVIYCQYQNVYAKQISSITGRCETIYTGSRCVLKCEAGTMEGGIALLIVAQDDCE